MLGWWRYGTLTSFVRIEAFNMFFKIIVLLVFAAILLSLSSGLVYLVKDKGQSKRTLRALTFRIGLSVFAFALLMAGHYAGWIQPHGLTP